MNTIVFDKKCQAVNHLAKSDPQISFLIDTIGPYNHERRKDYYRSLVYSIVGQQLSSTVAKVIKNRLLSLCGEIQPTNLINCSDEALREVGISRPKIAYIKNLSLQILDEKLNIESFDELPDSEVIAQLTKIKGIGSWTAEMFLIFSLGRLNVLSVKDVGLQRAMKWLYSLEKYPDEATMKKYGAIWDPYCTVASLYLWEVVNQNLISQPINLGAAKKY